MGDGVDTEEAKDEVHYRHCRFAATVARDQGGDGGGRVYEVVERDGGDVGEDQTQIHSDIISKNNNNILLCVSRQRPPRNIIVVYRCSSN